MSRKKIVWNEDSGDNFRYDVELLRDGGRSTRYIARLLGTTDKMVRKAISENERIERENEEWKKRIEFFEWCGFSEATFTEPPCGKTDLIEHERLIAFRNSPEFEEKWKYYNKNIEEIKQKKTKEWFERFALRGRSWVEFGQEVINID